MSMRIISLVPSLTETICEVGLAEALVGCTNFCIYPATLLAGVERVGGTKDPDIEKIHALKPTHVLFSKEENLKEHYEAIQVEKKFVSDVHKVSEVPGMLKSLSEMLQNNTNTLNLADKISYLLSKHKVSADMENVIYFIWREPWMVASNQTYIASALELRGKKIATLPLKPSKDSDANRYPNFDPNSIEHSHGRLLFSSEPYSFKKRHITEFLQKFSCEGWKTSLCDGKILSWYGYSTKLLLEEKSILSVD